MVKHVHISGTELTRLRNELYILTQRPHQVQGLSARQIRDRIVQIEGRLATATASKFYEKKYRRKRNR
ncbi:MAG: hypothetical protein JWL88_364 [Parcubacteria group bacterium]|nr:hypothetical protein [Parcubacteria group bacterium]